MKQCKVCGKEVKARGLCNAHYSKELRQERKHRKPHRYKPQGTACSVEDCSTKPAARGYCWKHLQRWVKHGDATYTKHSKEYGEGKDWYVGKDGYVLRWAGKDHPNATGHGRLYQHRDVMAGIIGRPLKSGENVHHKNGNRSDNRPENLELWTKGQPSGQRIQDKVRSAAMLLIEHYHDARKLEDELESFDKLMALLANTLEEK